MPRIDGVMQLLPGTYGEADTTIKSVPYNSQLDDFVNEMNGARPISAGGTGANSAAGARTALGVPGLTTANTFTLAQMAPQFIASGNTGQFRTTSDFLDIDPVGATTTQALVRLFRAVNTTNNNPQLVLYNGDGTSASWLIASRQGGIALSGPGVFSGNGSGLTGLSSAQVVPAGRDSVGAYGLLRNVSGATVNSGNTVAGADLRYVNLQNPGATGASPAGTWRNHSHTLANLESGLLVRTA